MEIFGKPEPFKKTNRLQQLMEHSKQEILQEAKKTPRSVPAPPSMVRLQSAPQNVLLLQGWFVYWSLLLGVCSSLPSMIRLQSASRNVLLLQGWLVY